LKILGVPITNSTTVMDNGKRIKEVEKEIRQLELEIGKITDDKEKKKKIQDKIDMNEQLLKGYLLLEKETNGSSNSGIDRRQTRASSKRPSNPSDITPLKKGKNDERNSKIDDEESYTTDDLYDATDPSEKSMEATYPIDVDANDDQPVKTDINIVGKRVEITQSQTKISAANTFENWIQIGPNGSPNKVKAKADTSDDKGKKKKGKVNQSLQVKAKVGGETNIEKDKRKKGNSKITPINTYKTSENQTKKSKDIEKSSTDKREEYNNTLPQRKLDFGINTKNNNNLDNHTDKKKGNVKEKEKNQTALNFKIAVTAGSFAIQEHTVRLRISWSGQQDGAGPLEKGQEIKRVLKSIALDLKEVDKDASILPWKETDDGCMLFNAGNIEEFNPLSATKYVDVPWYTKTFQKKMNHQNGIRITSRYDLRQFVDAWNKRSKEVKKTRTFISVKPAQMQGPSEYQLVGLLQGSVVNKDITLINKELRTITGIDDIEASWQTISQAGGADTKKLWERANQIAQQRSRKNSAMYERMKQQAAPNGLQVFVGDRFLVGEVRTKLYEAFGKEVDGKWPIWMDGSRMKFLPLSNRKIRNVAQIEKRLDWHIYQKATDEILFLEPMDIWTPIPGHETTTIGQHLHMLTSKDGTPIFRHIVHKWNSNPLINSWEITVRPEMVEEAVNILKGLKSQLHTTYGNDILNLFPTKQKGLNESVGYHQKQYPQYINEDDEIEKMIQDAGGSEDILDPGFKLFFMTDIAENSQNDESTMDLNSVDRSTATMKKKNKDKGRKECMELSDPEYCDESLATMSDMSSMAQSEKSVRFSVEIDKQEIKSEEGRKKKIQELLGKYHMTQKEYDKKATENPLMVETAVLMYYKRTNHMIRVMNCNLRLWRRQEMIQQVTKDKLASNPKSDETTKKIQDIPPTSKQIHETAAADLGS